MSFLSDITSYISSSHNHLCVGLDTDYEKIPLHIKTSDRTVSEHIFMFNKAIIDATAPFAAAYKSNLVFYASQGLEGWKALLETNKYIHATYPRIKIIADGKRSEMGFTAVHAAKEIFDAMQFDAMTVTPWFGEDTINEYRNRNNNAVFVLCHDSNPSAGDLQDVELAHGGKLYHYLTDLVVQKWNTSGNILVEAPLTYPTILKEIYDRTPAEQFFLVAGLGSQGGDIAALRLFRERKNFIVNASRSVIFASHGEDFAQKAGQQASHYADQLRTLIWE